MLKQLCFGVFITLIYVAQDCLLFNTTGLLQNNSKHSRTNIYKLTNLTLFLSIHSSNLCTVRYIVVVSLQKAKVHATIEFELTQMNAHLKSETPVCGLGLRLYIDT